jgi:hypothetical protein
MPTQKDIAKHKMDDMEWLVLRDHEMILDVSGSSLSHFNILILDKTIKVPHFVQQKMSSESRPVLSRAVPSFELFMTAWERLAETNKCTAPFISVGLQ